MSSELPILQGKHIHLSFKARKASVSSKNLYIAYESVSDGKKETIYFRPARIDGYLVSFKARGFGKYQLVAFSNK